ncbi:MAG TPA: hypothetical protein VIZ18_05530 [Ktedonobacteraceae bacterium]
MFDDFNKFDRQAGEGPQPEQTNWQGWTPPWMGREGDGPRGPFGPGRGPQFGGPRGPFGPGFGFGGPRGWGWRGPRGPFGPGFGFGWRHHGHHGPFGPGQWGIPDELLALRSEAAEVARLFAIASRGAFENKERLTQLRGFLDRSRKELSDMIYESGSGSAQGETPTGGESASGSSEVGQA